MSNECGTGETSVADVRVTCSVMLTADTDASARPHSGSVQCRLIAGDGSVVVAAVGVSVAVARCITHA